MLFQGVNFVRAASRGKPFWHAEAEVGSLWRSHPVKGDIGIVWIPESSIFNEVKAGSARYYAESVRGAYQGFFDSNIQPDYVHVDHIGEYAVVYLPYPVMLKEETANKLIDYVENGGRLICEGFRDTSGTGDM